MNNCVLTDSKHLEQYLAHSRHIINKSSGTTEGSKFNFHIQLSLAVYSSHRPFIQVKSWAPTPQTFFFFLTEAAQFMHVL